MSKLQIPKRVKPGLQLISSLANSDIEVLIKKLDFALGEKKLRDIRSIEEKVGELSPEDVTNIISSIISINRVLSDSEISKSKLISDICETMQSSEEIDYRIEQKNCQRFTENLNRFLSIEALCIQSKASDIKTANERIFCRTRIVTDIRPVFGSEADFDIKGAVILHDLQITYHPDNDREAHQTFHVKMDSEDLVSLRKVIERAESKEKTIEAHLKTSKIVNINE